MPRWSVYVGAPTVQRLVGSWGCAEIGAGGATLWWSENMSSAASAWPRNNLLDPGGRDDMFPNVAVQIFTEDKYIVMIT